jgi:predicted phage-related endonuclease
LAAEKGLTGKFCPGKSLLARDNYMAELAEEILTGLLDDDAQFSSFWMNRGNEIEPTARKWYAFITGNQVKEAGLIYFDESRRIGASVDGLIGDDGNAEIKCLKRFNHTKILLSDEVPQEYLDQIQGQMLVTGRAWCDFIAYHPGAFIEGYIQRVERDKPYIANLQFMLDKFLVELEEMVAKLRLMAA